MSALGEEADPKSANGPPDSATRWIWLAGAVFLALASLPQIAQTLLTPEGHVYLGLPRNGLDALSYYAKMREGWEGRWLYDDRYTTEPHRPALVYTYYISLGHIARWIGLSIFAVYQIARVGCGAALLWAADRFIRAVGMRGGARLLAFVMCFSASGVGWALGLSPVRRLWMAAGEAGWISVVEFGSPGETSLVEAFGFQSMANYSHFSLSSAAILLALADLWLWAEGRAGRAALVRIAGATFALAWIHPRLLLSVIMIGGMVAALRRLRGEGTERRWAAGLGSALAGAAGPAAAILLSMRGEPLWDEAANPAMESSSPMAYLLAYGALWPLAIWGAWRAWRRGEANAPMLCGWLLAGALLPYVPLSSQRRFIQGFNFPLAILAAQAVWGALQSRAWRAPVAAAVALALSLSTWTVYFGHELAAAGKAMYPLYVSKARVDAMEWLRGRAGKDEVVLCSYMTGLLAPPLAGARVVMGHWAETINPSAKTKELREFFDAATPAEAREELVRRHRATFVFVSVLESELGAYDPASEPARWELAWSSERIRIFRRRAESGP